MTEYKDGLQTEEKFQRDLELATRVLGHEPLSISTTSNILVMTREELEAYRTRLE